MSRLRLTKITTPSNPSANKGDLFLSSSFTPVAPAFIDESGNVCRLGGLTTQDYRLIKVTTILTGTVTYTPTSGTRALYIECIGGGGAGGGAATSSATCSCGTGGGGGAYSATWSTALVSGAHTVAVGAGGTAGAAGAAGNAGGDTDFKDTDGTSICTAKGGAGGTVLAAAVTLLFKQGSAGGDIASGVGDICIGGTPSNFAERHSGAIAAGSNGANGPIGGAGGLGAIATLTVGGAGSLGGAGGGGSMTATTAQVGGIGGAGFIRVSEFA